MGESTGWDFRRGLALLFVAVMHLGLVLALLMTTAPPSPGTGAPRPLELMLLPTRERPRIVADNLRPQRVRGDTAVAITPPPLGSLPPALAASGKGSGNGSDGNGTGVDWSAEARRALQAFEIRAGKPPENSMSDDSSTQYGWWPHAQRHAGERFKTDDGDWIVWINSTCYQIASAAAPSYAAGAPPARTVCLPQDPDRRDDRPARTSN